MPTYYSEDHEWIAVEGDIGTLGITTHAAEQLGDVVFVEMKDVGESFAKGDECGTVESVKAASEIYAPVGGEIVEVNETAADAPATLNEDPEGAAWLCKLRIADPAELEALMDKAGYDAFVGG
jgi:glycine cleavage system H protein